MKKLFLFLFFFVVYKVAAQEIYTPKYVSFNDQMQPRYVNNDKDYIVIEVPKKSQQELYLLVLKYLQKSSNDVNRTIKSNIPNTSIKYMFFHKAADYIVKTELPKKKNTSYYYTNNYGVYDQVWITLDFKPGKIKFQINGYNLYNDQTVDGISITSEDVVISKFGDPYPKLPAECTTTYNMCTKNAEGRYVLNSRVQEGLNRTFDWYVSSLVDFINDNSNNNW